MKPVSLRAPAALALTRVLLQREATRAAVSSLRDEVLAGLVRLGFCDAEPLDILVELAAGQLKVTTDTIFRDPGLERSLTVRCSLKVYGSVKGWGLTTMTISAYPVEAPFPDSRARCIGEPFLADSFTIIPSLGAKGTADELDAAWSSSLKRYVSEPGPRDIMERAGDFLGKFAEILRP